MVKLEEVRGGPKIVRLTASILLRAIFAELADPILGFSAKLWGSRFFYDTFFKLQNTLMATYFIFFESANRDLVACFFHTAIHLLRALEAVNDHFGRKRR